MSQATITEKYGPGLTATATVITDIDRITFDLARSMLFIKVSTSPQVLEYSLNALATCTFTISGTTYTISMTT